MHSENFQPGGPAQVFKVMVTAAMAGAGVMVYEGVEECGDATVGPDVSHMQQAAWTQHFVHIVQQLFEMLDVMRGRETDHAIGAAPVQGPDAIGINNLGNRAEPRGEVKVDHLQWRVRLRSLQELYEVAAAGRDVDQPLMGRERAVGEQLSELAITGARSKSHRLVI